MDMSSDQWKDRRMIAFMIYIYSCLCYWDRLVNTGASMLISKSWGSPISAALVLAVYGHLQVALNTRQGSAT